MLWRMESGLAASSSAPGCQASPHNQRNEQEIARGHLWIGLPDAAPTLLDRTSPDLFDCREIRSVSKGWSSYVAFKSQFAALEGSNGARRHMNADAT